MSAEQNLIKKQQALVHVMSELATVSGALCLAIQDEKLNDCYLPVLVSLRKKLLIIQADVGEEIRRYVLRSVGP